MSDVEMVIKIPEELKNKIDGANDDNYKTYIWWFDATLYRAIKEGTVLPKGHGRLIDADKTLEVAWQEFYRHEEEWEEKDEDYIPLHRFYDQNGFECCQQTLVNAPTIIEADREALSEINVKEVCEHIKEKREQGEQDGAQN